MANNYWRDVTLKEVADVNPDSIDRKWPYDHISYIDISSVGQGYISIKPAFISLVDAPSRAKRRVRLGDTVLSTVRPNRRSMFYASDPSPDWIVSTGFAVIRPKQDMISPRYLYSCVFNQTFTDYLVAHEIGAAYPAVSVNDILNAPIHFPPRKEQDAIAGILGALDDKIELNRQMCKTLDDTAQAIFKSWFVDFDPVHAKAAGKQPVGLKPEIAALFPDSFVDSELGKIPKKWSVRAIGEMIQVLGGGTPSTKDSSFWINGVHPFCTPKDMSSLSVPLLLSTERKLTDDGIARISSGQLPLGTVLLSSRAPIGYLAVTEIPVSINQGIIAMVCNEHFPNYYALHWTRTNLGIILSKANGSTFLEISKSNFRLIKAIVPTVEVLNSYMGLVEPLYSRIESMLLENQLLITIRDELLPKLISGDLRINCTERILERGA